MKFAVYKTQYCRDQHIPQGYWYSEKIGEVETDEHVEDTAVLRSVSQKTKIPFNHLRVVEE